MLWISAEVLQMWFRITGENRTECWWSLQLGADWSTDAACTILLHTTEDHVVQMMTWNYSIAMKKFFPVIKSKIYLWEIWRHATKHQCQIWDQERAKNKIHFRALNIEEWGPLENHSFGKFGFNIKEGWSRGRRRGWLNSEVSREATVTLNLSSCFYSCFIPTES